MTKVSQAEAREKGFMIDEHCYPHVAYKGERFNPTTWCYVSTEDEEDLQRQLAEVTRERDTLKAMVDLHDALNDRRRTQTNETPFKRRKHENE